MPQTAILRGEDLAGKGVRKGGREIRHSCMQGRWWKAVSRQEREREETKKVSRAK